VPQALGGVRLADDLATVIDAACLAVGVAGQHPQVDRVALAVPQHCVAGAVTSDGRVAHHLPTRIDVVRLADGAAGQVGQLGPATIPPGRGLGVPTRVVRAADDLPVIVLTEGPAGRATGRHAEVSESAADLYHRVRPGEADDLAAIAHVGGVAVVSARDICQARDRVALARLVVIRQRTAAGTNTQDQIEHKHQPKMTQQHKKPPLLAAGPRRW
jgi:hypothetical protein